MNIRLEPARLSGSAALIEGRAHDMAARQARVQGAVEALQEGWRGQAAHRFASLWEEWRHGATSVIDRLAAEAEALRQARDQVTEGDRVVGGSHERLRGRLG